MKKTVWLSFDLAVGGDYENLYAWLDDHEAKECGDGLAMIEFAAEGEIHDALKGDLTKQVNFSKKDRVYAVWREEDKTRGRFLVGKRKFAPWEGYGTHNQTEDVEVG